MEKYSVALDKARAFREHKMKAHMSFLELAVMAKEIKSSGCWKDIGDGTWSSYCQDREVGLGEPVSSVNNLIGIVDTYIANKLLTIDEAKTAGWMRLQTNMSTMKKIPVADQSKAKDILLEDGTPADVKDDLRQLVPEDDRKPVNHIETAVRNLSKAWQEINQISVDEISEDDVERLNGYLAKFQGWFVRRGV